jgi:hypothetical protein
MTWDGLERRVHVSLSEEQMEHIAESAANKAVEKVMAHIYQEIGKSVVKKVIMWIGIATVAVMAWLVGTGHIK